jgi:hypothetical protein
MLKQVVFFALLLVQIFADNCLLQVPDNPLTPQGLMTPYQLVGAGCNEATILMSRFVHAVILNTDNGGVSLYNPLVINAGSIPEVAPVPVSFTPNNHVVGIWMGSNSNTLVLSNTVGITNGNCFSGTPNSPFGQFAFCNVQNFWKAMEMVRAQGLLAVPPIGIAPDGAPCPTVRDFFVVDMDPDDGVPTTYLITANGNPIQKTLNNMKLNIQAEIANDGDHHLVSGFVSPSTGCQQWLVQDLADPGVKRNALPMNELQALYYQPMPVEALPNTDPMTTTNNAPDIVKLNLYRKAVYQPQINNLVEADPAVFCRSYANITVPRLRSLSTMLKNTVSPMAGTNLFDFMKTRCSATYAALNCVGLTGVQDPFVGIMRSASAPIAQKKDYFNWEEYKEGGFDDAITYRSYRGGHTQEFSKYSK